jgi:hypothetical protein
VREAPAGAVYIAAATAAGAAAALPQRQASSARWLVCMCRQARRRR